MPKIPAIALTLLLCLALPAFAGLCGKCADRSYTKDIGECTVCRGVTTSGELRLCFACSDKLGQCAHCRTALKPASAAAPAASSPTAISTEKDGSFRAEGWVYVVHITNAGSRSQGVVGTLSFHDAAVPVPAQVNDYYVTPWGKLYWAGDPVVAFGAHGWMPKPLVHAPVGSGLTKP